MKNILFSTAVLLAVGELRNQGTFSVHDVTKLLRQKVNNFDFGLKDKQQEIINNGFSYRIEHDEVKQVFYDLFENNVITNLVSRFNGTYNEFSNSAANPTAILRIKAASAPLKPFVSQQVVFGKGGKSSIPLISYLRSRSGNTTMKQIQSRFKGDPTTCQQYADKLVKLGFIICNANAPASQQYVIT